MDIGIDEIVRRRIPIGQGGPKFFPVAGLIILDDTSEQVARLESGPAQGERDFFADDGTDDGAVAGDEHLLHDGLAAALDLDLFPDRLPVAPLTFVQVLVRRLRIQFFDVEVLDILPGGGQAPGAVLVMTDDDAGRTGKGDTGHVVAGAVEMDLVPAGRHRQGEVSIVGQQGLTCGRTRTGHHPLVAAAGSHARC